VASALTIPTLVVTAQQNPPGAPGEDAEAGTPDAAATPDVPACRVDVPAEATPEAGEACLRGEVPVHIAIAAIDVEADIEIQEIIAGELQDPTGPTLVTWYKETSRLGERGNGVYAGHLNYWGVPEGVFFAIKTLLPGDAIVLTGANGEDFTYAVVWVENQPGQEPPSAEVLGPTEEESITLITCGGEWDTTIAEYNERTTVRAVRQEVPPA
jgi:sortase (surface protein transpeptidase)